MDGGLLAAEKPGERRGSPRRPLALRMQVWPEGSRTTGPCGATLGELSAAGLFFVSSVAYPLGTVVWLRACWGRQTHYLKGIVRRATRECVAGQTRYGYGLEYVSSPQTARFLEAATSLMTSHRP